VRAIDVDQHLYEPRSMWRDYIDPALRDKALAIVDDERGYPWLSWQGRPLYLAEVQFPGKAKPIGDLRLRIERDEPAEERYEDVLPPAYSDPKARVGKLDEWGIDQAVLFPNFGLLWEDMLGHDVEALCANMRAYNRWAADAVAEGGGRLHGVAHVTLTEVDWAVAEIETLGKAGVRLAMTAPAPVNGKPLAHTDFDRVWDAFVSHGVSPVFHVGGFKGALDPAWYQGDAEPVDRLMDSVFLWVPPAVALANLIIGGALDRHPELRIGVVELSAHWVPQFLLMLEGSWGFYAARHGRPIRDLPLKPSEYFRRQVRVAALAYEQPAHLVDLVGEDMFMFGSDWPHAEGIADPLRDYEQAVPEMSGTARQKLFGGNAAWLLRQA
jgi:predicted TIM-barrel fold metal-dependent hydrolase